MPRRVWLAILLAFCLHGALILAGRYHLSFDAYTHMLFADHYRMDWWSLWDPRWYTGFSVTSYPPLVHQLIALLAYLVGVDAAFAIVLWAVLTAYPMAVYVFSRVFTGRVVAGNAALGAALLPSVYMAAHVFGQIPTVTATLFALFGLAALAEYLRHGGKLNAALALALFAVVMAAHHATLLFLPWIIIGLVLHVLLNREVDRRVLILRLAIILPLATLVGLAVIWPFWAWGLEQSMQVPIDHLSRHNFLIDPAAILVFFLPMYGLLVFLIPFAFWYGRRRRYAGLAGAFLPLLILGLGGTTPLPRLLFGTGWEWLTYDRFAFWASFLLLPFFGVALVLIRRRLPQSRFSALYVRLAGFSTGEPAVKNGRVRLWATTAIFTLSGLIAMTIGLLPSFVQFQPAPVNMQPIVDFLAQDDRSQWRYLTFGFGDQFAYLSRLTKATTIDGSYHTARLLPELRTSGLPQIDVAYWTDKGVNALDPILQKSGTHGVRWGFVNLAAYVPVLERNGWLKLSTLSNGVQVWENPAAVLPGPSPVPPADPFASFSWGVFPLSALLISAALAWMRFRPARAQKSLLAVHQFIVGLLPVGLCGWYLVDLAANPVPKVFFLYTDGVLFLSDALALIALFAWCIPRYLGPQQARETGGADPAAPHIAHRDVRRSQPWLRPFDPQHIQRWFLALCLLASLSSLWSTNWRTSLYFSVQLWLVFGLFLSLRDRPQVWRSVAIGFCAALAFQIFVGFWQFAAQSTDFMRPLGMSWPGQLEAITPGASVVQLANGMRWLRVYGTFPHPNILAGVIVSFLAGPLTLFLTGAKRNLWLIALLTLSAALLVLTFSRSAWLGMAAAALVLSIHRSRLEYKRLLVLALAGLAGLLLSAVPLYTLIITRMGGGPGVNTEDFSNQARLWLVQVAFDMIRSHPILGVGSGSFLLEYARSAPYGYLIEPVHNLPLLLSAELGIPGAIILVGLVFSILRGSLRATHPRTVIFSAALIGLLTISLFDHYLWTLAPGRMLLGLILGLWAGQLGSEAGDAQDGTPAIQSGRAASALLT